jgi:DNA repair photolyase
MVAGAAHARVSYPWSVPESSHRLPLLERRVDELVRRLIAPLLGGRVSRSGWRLIGWDAEQGISLSLERPGSVVLVELEKRDEALDCHARTARFNVCARRQYGSPELGPADRAMVDSLVGMIRERERLLPVVERASTARQAELRLIRVDRVLVSEGRAHYYVNPYVGCTIGCDFCYAAPRADFSRSLEGLPELSWGSWVDVKVNAAEVLAREVTLHPPGVVRFSPILTDPYQPAEKKYRITRQCLEVLLDAKFAPIILTRAARVSEDLELLARFERSSVGMSVPTDDDRYRMIFEPGGDPIDLRIAALEQARARGVKTFAVIQPMLPMDPDRLVRLLAPLVSAVRIDRMHFLERSRKVYEDAGLSWACEQQFFDETHQKLALAFRAAGVRVDELDDLAGLLAG